MNKIFNVFSVAAMCMAIVSCGAPSEKSIAEDAISDAAKFVKAEMAADEDEMEFEGDPGTLRYSEYYFLIQERNQAIDNAIKAIANDYGYDTDLKKRRNSYFSFTRKMEEEFSNNRNQYEDAKARKRQADTTLIRVSDIIMAHYQEPLLKAMKEIDGAEFPVYYSDRYVSDVTANIMLSPRNYENGTINIRVNMTLNNPSVSHNVFFTLEGLAKNAKRVQKFETDEATESMKYKSGTRVYFDITLLNDQLDCVGIDITRCSTDGF